VPLGAQRTLPLGVQAGEVGARRADARCERRPHLLETLVGRAHDQLAGRDVGESGRSPEAAQLASPAVAHDPPLVQSLGAWVHEGCRIPEGAKQRHAASVVPHGGGHDAARTSDAAHLAHTSLGIVEEVEDELREHRVETGIFERKALGDAGEDIGAGEASAAGLDEGLRRIDCGDVRSSEQIREHARERARAAADIERSLTRLDARDPSESFGELPPVAADVAVVGLGGSAKRRRAFHGQSLAPLAHEYHGLMSRCAGIVLAGGRSSRMGAPKAALEWHGATLLERIARLLYRVLDGPIVVVRAPGQELLPLPRPVELAEDAHEGRGPLEGIAAGLRALGGRADAAYISSTDVPLLHPAFVRHVAGALLDGADIAVPRAEGRMHPLASAYRTSVLPVVEGLIASERMRPAFLFEEVRTRFLEEDELRAVDPELSSLRNLNTRSDYEQALALPAPAVRVERYGTLRRAGSNGAVAVRAATLGAAASAAGVQLDAHVVAALNGDQITRDPSLPLAEGDVVSLMSADAGGWPS
jgi:molybdenum cofactor guanylyltransferase